MIANGIKGLGIVLILLFAGALAGVETPIETEENENNTITLTFEFDKEDFEIERKNAYVAIDCKKEMNYVVKEGYPMLPYDVKVLKFPVGTVIEDVEIEEINTERKEINQKLIPAPPVKADSFQRIEGEIYMKNKPYPENWISYHIGVGVEDNERAIFLVIHAYPYRYNPVKNELEFLKHGKVKITYTLPSKPLFNKDEYDLLIICPSQWVEQLQPLKEHKEKYGIKTIIVSLDEIYGGKYFATQGRDDAEKVKYFIKDAIENWGIEYVLLVGGRKFSKEEWIMPVRYAYSIDKVPPFTENGYLSDLYFADIYDANGNFSSWDTNGNGIYAEYDYNGRYDDVDLYPDVYVGRLPCRNKLELKIVVNKIIQYEKGQGEWKRRAILCGGDTDLNDRDDINEGEYLNEKVAEVLEDYDCIFLWTSLNTLSRKNFWQEMMKGAKFVDLSGHGSPNSWATHPHNSDEWIGITLFDIFTYFNGEKLPIFFANACHTCQFNLTYECFGWSFVKKAGGGAIAFIGSTGLSYGFGGYATAESLSGYLEIEFFRNHNEEFLGNAFYNAIISYLNNIPMDDWQDYKTVEEYVLFGLPCLKMN